MVSNGAKIELPIYAAPKTMLFQLNQYAVHYTKESQSIQYRRHTDATEKTKEKGRKVTFQVNGEIKKRFRRCGVWSYLGHQATVTP